jgi:serine/threonine-protein kinase HipA
MAKNIKKVKAAEVILWGKRVGAVAWDADKAFATFEYAPSFIKDGFDISPIEMRRRAGIFSFPELERKTFYGLPGLLADSLPDKFGNALINAWLARHGRSKDDFSPVERLCYIGARGMGALEFKPAIGGKERTAVPI